MRLSTWDPPSTHISSEKNGLMYKYEAYTVTSSALHLIGVALVIP